jgi:thiamine-monophosphate kinase
MGVENEENGEGKKEYGRHDLVKHICEKLSIEPRETAFGTHTSPAGKQQVVAIDLMLEGIDFNLVYFPLAHLGYKAVVRVLAGITASGATPEAISVKAGISSRFSVEQTTELFGGMKMAADKYGITISGIDLMVSLTGLTISSAGWGTKESKSKVNQEAPKPNDLICVTGDLGAAYTGLQVLERERRIFEEGAAVQPDLSDYQYVIGRQLKPDFMKDINSLLGEAGVTPSVMTVVREGLASELTGMTIEAKLGCRLYWDRIPIDTETHRVAAELNSDPVIAALNGGEDYEFLFFAPLAQSTAIEKMKGVTIAGYLTDESEGRYIVTPENSLLTLTAQGFTTASP